MPSARVIQTNFTSGEVSEHLSGRVDLPQYANSVHCLLNMVPRSLGGAYSRAGSAFVAAAKYQGKVPHLIPFEVSRTEAYMMEVGEYYLRFFINRAMLRKATQSPDYTLTLSAVTGYSVTASITRTTPAANLTLESAATGQGWTVTASAGVFTSADVGKVLEEFTGGTGKAYIATYVAADEIKIDTYEAFSGTSIASGDWRLGLFISTEMDRARVITVGAASARVRSVTDTATATVFVLADFAGTSHVSGTWTLTGQPVEVTTPYAESDVPTLRTEQSADVMYIAHPSYYPRKLTRTSATTFLLAQMEPDPPPTFEVGTTIDASLNNLTLSAKTVGTARTVTAASAAFLPADVGRTISFSTGLALITTFTLTTVVVVDILAAFPDTSITTGTVTIGLSPQARLVLENKGPKGRSILVQLADPNDSSRVAATWPTLEWSTIDGFRATDVGKFLVGGGGVLEVYAYVNAYSVRAKIVTPVDDALGANLEADQSGDIDIGPWRIGPGVWTLEDESWSATYGYPSTVCLAAGRLYFASTTTQPDTIWSSEVGGYENFYEGLGDSDGIEIPAGNGPVSEIRWMKRGGRGLLYGTLAGEYTLSGPGGDPITATGPPEIREHTTYGCDYTVDALRTSKTVLFLQRGKRRLREFATDPNAIDTTYTAPDIALLSEHLLRGGNGITRMARAETPDSIVFAVTTTGQLLTLTYERDEKIVAWAHHVTGRDQDLSDGLFESVAVMPNMCGNGDEVWVTVRRELTGGTARYVEVFDGAFTVDSAVAHVTGASAEEFRGLEHLEGETIKIVVDYTTVYTLTVANGTITLPATITEGQMGLYFLPHFETQRPEIPTQAGTSQMRLKRWSQIGLRLVCTYGNPTINGEAVVYPTGASTNPYTGDVLLHAPAAWETDARVTVEQPDPLPFGVLAFSGRLQVDDG